VVFLGEHPYRSGENNNVSSLELPAGQGKFLEELADQGLPIILVILAGRPLAIPREARLAQAVLYAWHPGIEGGAAITDILFGSAVPLAKLPVTMPRATGQVPIYYNHKSSGRPSGTEFFPRRYIDIPQAPLFPFGYGLSYTQFEYTGLQISSKEMTQNNEISVNISNIGNFTGTEIAQFYLRDLVGSVTRPIKELKGFQRVTLQPGETQRITFNLSAEDLLFTGIDNQPTLEAGEYQVWVGPNSDSGLQDQFILRV
jgi:beta-glucosidase